MTEPVQEVLGEVDHDVEEGIGLALSGGGYRAMLFHLGTFIRLHETSVLARVARISSVSGGSITSAKVALEWDRLVDADAFWGLVIEPILSVASRTIDVGSIAGGVLLPGSVADRVSAFYDEHLFRGATLQDLPDTPRFVINATNVETGSLWRFMKPYMRDYRVGQVDAPRTPLADAVTASSAFPPVLSPFTLELDRSDFSRIEPGVDPAFLQDVSLTDGGVYDNLGLETVYKRYRTLLVSDAGGALAPDPTPPADWGRHAKRVLDIIHGQVSNVRVRQLVEAYRDGRRSGAYWGIRMDAGSTTSDLPPAAPARTSELAAVATRLKRLPRETQERLVNWGYLACQLSIQTHWSEAPEGPRPSLPFPNQPI